MKKFWVVTILWIMLTVPAYPSGNDSTLSPAETGKKIAQNSVGRRFGWRYQKVCTYYGCLMLAEAAGEPEITARVAAGYEPFLKGRRKPHSGHVDYNVFGIWPFELFRQTGEQKYLDIPAKLAGDEFKDPSPDGLSGLSRFWVDDMYMIGSLQVQAYKSMKDTVFLNRAARQLVVYCNRLQRDNGLFHHREDAPFFWGRGNGWAAAAMTEVLLVLPPQHKDYKPLMASYLKMMGMLLSLQGADGMWHQLLDDPASYPESSCTGMFIYAMASGLDRGWLPAGEFMDKTRKGWQALAGYVDRNGEVRNVCVGTNARNNKEHYLSRPRSTGNFHGQAAALWAATAMIRLNKQY